MNTPIMTPAQFAAETACFGTVTEVANTDAPVRVASKKFEAGQVYMTRSACDYDCKFHYYIVKRTEKSVWVRSARQNADGSFTPYDGVTRRAVDSHYSDSELEVIYPEGKYSMCPVLTPEDLQ